MSKLKPIVTDTYDFPTLIRDGNVYVDKTAYLHRLVSKVDGTLFFMSRPRRFGKSLMISTLEQIFKGNKALFKGLAISRLKYDWQRYPVIHLDMSELDPTRGTREVCRDLSALIAARMKAAGLEIPGSGSPGILLGCLIDGLAKRSKTGQIVILVDEYDNPISGLLGCPKELDAMQQALQHFYSIFKSRAPQIRFLMMTGVSKFAKLSVFSGLNNLTDLSMFPEYASLLGYTRAELSEFFAPQIDDFARARKTTRKQIVEELLLWYDSYCFSPDTSIRVCNPVSIGCALTQKKFAGFWDRTGNATLIIERLRKAGRIPTDLENVKVRANIMDACDPYDLPYASLMYQAGYLTIKDASSDGMLTLGIPNEEVRQSIYGGFLSRIFRKSEKAFESRAQMVMSVLDAPTFDVKKFSEILGSVFAMVPHEWKLKNEAEAKRYFLLFMKMAGADITPELESSKGRADVVVETEKAVYIFEFKYGKTARAALKQINANGYGKPHAADKRRVIAIGVNYDPRKAGIGVVSEVVNPSDEVVNPVDEVVNEVVKSHPGLRKPELVPLVGKSRATVERALASLISSGRVEFRGAPKTGGYYVR